MESSRVMLFYVVIVCEDVKGRSKKKENKNLAQKGNLFPTGGARTFWGEEVWGRGKQGWGMGELEGVRIGEGEVWGKGKTGGGGIGLGGGRGRGRGLGLGGGDSREE